MTYQELLDEFCKRRAEDPNQFADYSKMKVRTELDTLLWAMQALLEKIRDEREGPR